MKKLFILTAITALVTSTYSGITKINNTVVTINNNQEESSAINFDELIADAIVKTFRTTERYLGRTHSNISVTNIKRENFNVTDVNTTLNGEPEISLDETPIYMGNNVLTNSSPLNQQLSTTEFKYSLTDQVNFSVTKGISLDIGTSFGFFNNTFNFNYSKTETISQKITNELIVPKQNLTIPANSKWDINVYFSKNTIKLNLTLNAKISGTITCTINYDWTSQSFEIEIPTALGFLSSLPEGISIDWKNNQVIFKGAAILTNPVQSNNFFITTKKI